MYLNIGFEEGIRDMKPGGKRRIIIPPELGPPVSLFHIFYSFLMIICVYWCWTNKYSISGGIYHTILVYALTVPNKTFSLHLIIFSKTK